MRVGLLDDLVSGIGSERDLSERLAYHGLDASVWWRVAVLDIEDVTGRHSQGGDRTEEQIQELKTALLESAERFLGDHGLPLSDGAEERHCGGAGPVRRHRPSGGGTDPHAALSHHRAGVGDRHGEHRGLGAGTWSGGRGRRASGRRWRRRISPSVVADSGSGSSTNSTPRSVCWRRRAFEALTAIYEDTVAPLAEHDRLTNSHLVDTLRAYLEADRSVGSAAATLHMHRNTLTKRLERIETLVGLSLDRQRRPGLAHVGVAGLGVARWDRREPRRWSASPCARDVALPGRLGAQGLSR